MKNIKSDKHPIKGLYFVVNIKSKIGIIVKIRVKTVK